MSLKLDQNSLESQGLDKNLIILEPRKCYVRREETVNKFGNLLLGSLNNRIPNPVFNQQFS